MPQDATTKWWQLKLVLVLLGHQTWNWICPHYWLGSSIFLSLGGGGEICRILKVRKVWMSAHHPMNNSIEECFHKFVCQVFHVMLHTLQYKRMAIYVWIVTCCYVLKMPPQNGGIHSMERPYQCDLCSKSLFSVKCILQIHQCIHSLEWSSTVARRSRSVLIVIWRHIRASISGGGPRLWDAVH
jgi:hypothetical protein